jgi:protein-S-isoprenylcysteine O-methyltransferase Ste14
MRRILSLLYGLAVYALFLAVFVYSIGFVWNVLVPKSLDVGASPLPGPPLPVDLGLLGLFAIQHSGMARQGFKKRWKKVVPRHLERSTYVLAATLLLALVMWGWKPLPTTLWSASDPVLAGALRVVSAAGWLVVLLSTFLIDHFHLFGLRQVWTHLRGGKLEPPTFQTPLLYRHVRHPLYLGFIAAFWAAPSMSVGHLLFAGLTTGWMLLAIQLEERDLVRFHGDAYRAYRRRVPMLVPFPKGESGGDSKRAADSMGRPEME